jgi:uncharacterized repeat protein (TIGR03837 family)
VKWDIFCNVVDNFGDIGVCWRLAQQLHVEHGLQICLWVDNFEAAQKIIHDLDLTKNQQIINEIKILKWHAEADFSQAADFVIETFSCELPPAYLEAMAQKKSKWVNLEYLSAEPWVADFHAKPSPQPQFNLTRHFYFPGFTENTGGLIRERDVEIKENFVEDKPLKISLFCYENAPIHNLFDALKANNHAVSVHVPESIIWPKIAEYFGKKAVQAGEILSKNNLSVHTLPFLSQADYDQLLRDCDLNFVRGEDSWLRAIWAGKPFIWQPYVQTEDAHIAKLNAFLDVFYANYEQKDMLWKAHGYWSAGHVPKDVLQACLHDLSSLKAHTLQQSQQLANQQDLATKLVNFCNKL